MHGYTESFAALNIVLASATKKCMVGWVNFPKSSIKLDAVQEGFWTQAPWKFIICSWLKPSSPTFIVKKF